VKILPEKLSPKPATGCLLALYILYILFAAFVLAMSKGHASRELSNPWMSVWFSAFFIVPAYIFIFNRIYDQLHGFDFFCLCIPLPALFIFSLSCNQSTGDGYIYKPAVVLILTGIYFLVLPLSKRYPRVSRSTISMALLALMLAGVALVTYYIPG